MRPTTRFLTSLKSVQWGSLWYLAGRTLPVGRNPARAGGTAQEVISGLIEWIFAAQDATPDGGVSAGYHLLYGWLPSYPETTGYMISTLTKVHHVLRNEEALERALRMTEWELSIQFPEGSFPGWSRGASPAAPMVFDTGQVLQGLIAAYQETGDERYVRAAVRAGNWLVGVQDADGAWRRFEFNGTEHTYNTRVAWPLLELYEVTSDQRYKQAAIANLDWTLGHLNDRAWLRYCAFRPDSRAYTHTIAYAIEGLVESGAALGEERYVEAAERLSGTLMGIWEQKEFIPGDFDEDWDGSYSYSCLTGDAQLALCWLRLYEVTGKRRYHENALRLTTFLERMVDLSSRYCGIRGGLGGSTPLWKGYLPLFFPNWSAKFLLDVLLMEAACWIV